MRRVEIIVATEIPTRRVMWAGVRDLIRAQWSQMGLKAFSGPVAIGYTWYTADVKSWHRHGRLWHHLVMAVWCCLEGAEPCIGGCRFVKAEQPQLRIHIEELV